MLYLVEWIGVPYTCEETGDLKWCGNYLNRVGGAPKWYTKSNLDDEYLVQHMVLGVVKVDPISDSEIFKEGLKHHLHKDKYMLKSMMGIMVMIYS